MLTVAWSLETTAMVECPLLTTDVSQRTEYLRSNGLKANALHSAQSVNLKKRFAVSAVACANTRSSVAMANVS